MSIARPRGISLSQGLFLRLGLVPFVEVRGLHLALEVCPVVDGCPFVEVRP